MTGEERLELLRRRVLSQSEFAGGLAQDLEKASSEGRTAEACFLAQVFVACCTELNHSLWPGGRRLIDIIAVNVAYPLRITAPPPRVVSRTTCGRLARLPGRAEVTHHLDPSCEQFSGPFYMLAVAPSCLTPASPLPTRD